jgi:hypothetical protein
VLVVAVSYIIRVEYYSLKVDEFFSLQGQRAVEAQTWAGAEHGASVLGESPFTCQNASAVSDDKLQFDVRLARIPRLKATDVQKNL